METIASGRIPTKVLETIYKSDQSGTDMIPFEERGAARNWLRELIVNYAYLERHIAFLQGLYGELFEYDRPDRFDESAYHLPLQGATSRFKHREPLADERIVAVCDDGTDALSDAEVARLLLNPVALLDLYRVIDELSPEAWREAFHEAGKATIALEAEVKREDDPKSQTIPLRRGDIYRGPATIAAIAASLFIGIAIGTKTFRGKGDESGLTAWSAEATYVVGGTKGTGQVSRLEITSDLDGFATVIVLYPTGQPAIIPYPEEKPISVKPGEKNDSLNLPSDRTGPAIALIVVTATPSVADIPRELNGKTFSSSQVEELRVLLDKTLRALHYRDIAFTQLALPATNE